MNYLSLCLQQLIRGLLARRAKLRKNISYYAHIYIHIYIYIGLKQTYYGELRSVFCGGPTPPVSFPTWPLAVHSQTHNSVGLDSEVNSLVPGEFTQVKDTGTRL